MKAIFYHLLLPALAWATSFNSGIPKMTPDCERKAREDILGLINENVDEDGIKTLIPAFVRLIFHDCAGGCDGCIAQENPGNGGLSKIVDLIDTVYNGKYCKMMSRADFWALCAVVAVEESVKMNNEKFCPFFGNPDWCPMPNVDLHFQYGRKDCPSSPYYQSDDADTPDLPDGMGDLHHVLDYFDRMFYFGAFESTAASAGHSLGKANPLTSQFDGAWESIYNEDGLNRFYFLNMINPDLGWKQEQNDPLLPDPTGRDVFQWNGKSEIAGTEYIMLNSDMALFKDVNISDLSVSGQSQCTYQTCPMSSTANFIYPLAIDVNVLAGSFGYVMQRIIENGYVLKDPTESAEQANAQMSPKAASLLNAIEKDLREYLGHSVEKRQKNLQELMAAVEAVLISIFGEPKENTEN